MANKRLGRKGNSSGLPTPAKHTSTRKFGHSKSLGEQSEKLGFGQRIPLANHPEDLRFDEKHYRNNEVIARYRLIYSLGGLILGLACILGGIVLFLRGVSGATSWTAKLLGAESNITDAAPGAILFIVGLFLVVTTRFRHRTVGSQAAAGPPQERQ